MEKPHSRIVGLETDYCETIIWNGHRCSLDWIFKIHWNRYIFDPFCCRTSQSTISNTTKSRVKSCWIFPMTCCHHIKLHSVDMKQVIKIPCSKSIETSYT